MKRHAPGTLRRSPPALRRLLTGLLTGLLVVSLLAACGERRASSGAGTPRSVEPYRYRPPAPAGKGPVVVAVGDMVCAPGKPQTEKTCRDAEAAKLARQYRPQQLFTLGDQQYGDGTLATYRAHYAKTWGKLRDITRPVPGDDAYEASGYFDYFRNQTRPPGYYDFDVGSWRVYALNDNCTKIDCDTELAWLADEMSENPSRCSAIFMHTPLYGSGIEKGGQPRVIRPFWRVALRHGADLALAGHLHQYEHLAPMDADGRLSRTGMTQLIAGTGGASMRPLTGPRAKHSLEFDNSTAGVLALRLNAGGFAWRYRTVDGYNIDDGTQRCH